MTVIRRVGHTPNPGAHRAARRGGLAAVVAVLLVGTITIAAGASTTTSTTTGPEQPTLRVERVTLTPDGSTEAVVSVTGIAPGDTLTDGDVMVLEEGVRIPDVSVGPVASEPSGETPAAVLTVDISGSTAGEPLEAAIEAALELTTELEAAGVAVGLVAFGPDVSVLTRLDEPAGSVARALSGLAAAGGTSLYDGIARSARLLADHDGPRDIVVFSDGVDTTSSTDLTGARGLAVDGEIRVTSVALDTGDMDLAPLQSVATATGGQVIRVAEPAQLLAAFRGVAADLTNRFVLTWTAELVPAPATQLSVEVSVSTDAGTVTDDLVVLNTRVPVITPPRVYEPPQAPIGLLANEAGLVLGVVTAFLSVLIGGVLILSGAGERRRRLRLASQLPAWDGIGDGPTAAIIATASLTDRAAEAMDRLPTPEGLEERLGVLLERADWPMRSSEFQLVTVGATFGGLVIPLILFRSLPLAVLVALAGAAGPYVMLKLAVARRAAKFEDQLPSVLMLLAGALRAGHGFTTALEGTVRETDEPARSELRRASVEQRLGRSVDSALLGVAERLQSSDLRWVVNAIAIQQEVGGNLAELLDNVASTLRDRASLGRNVKALAAEGRYSAWIIGLLPFAMFMIMTVINPEYVRFLYTDPRGLAMSVIAIVLMAIGGLVLRKLVQPRF